MFIHEGETEREGVRKRGVIKDGGEVGDTDITSVWTACVCGGQQKKEVGDETEEVCRCIFLCMALKWKKNLFSNGGQENYGLVKT